MIIRLPEPEVKILVDRDPNLHADAHDFDSHTSDLEEISCKIFSAHFGQLSIIFLWLSDMYFHDARFSNYEAWLSNPTHIGPSAQVVWPIVGQEILNGNVGGGFRGIQITSGFFRFVDPKEIPLPHQFILNRDLLAQLYPSFAEGATPFSYLELVKICGISYFSWRIRSSDWGYCNSFPNSGYVRLLTIVVAHHMYSMPSYPYLATDYGTQLSLFTHHMWIGGFLIVGAAAHVAIFMVRDYDPTTRYNDLLDRVLRHRDAIISHLNWVCIFLGFHNFGRPQDMFSDIAIQLQPVFAQWIQNTHTLAPGVTALGATVSTSLTWGGGDLVAVGGKVALLPIPLGTADFLVHHIHAFTIHMTVLILLKAVLFARSSHLIPDKANIDFRFPCDGPGRGETLIFHFSWKMESDVWGSISDQGVVTHITGGNFAQSSITINGWLRDFLWAQALAFSLMFLFSGRGYWQELIESIVWAYNKLKVAPATQPEP
ncbi:hypothetical protein ERO13_A01G164480v2 [Gossypium hirsutum]|nr:hypothetical protein ERO13_A01G164480v2 [Gossypium hirsutum]